MRDNPCIWKLPLRIRETPPRTVAFQWIATQYIIHFDRYIEYANTLRFLQKKRDGSVFSDIQHQWRINDKLLFEPDSDELF